MFIFPHKSRLKHKKNPAVRAGGSDLADCGCKLPLHIWCPDPGPGYLERGQSIRIELLLIVGVSGE